MGQKVEELVLHTAGQDKPEAQVFLSTGEKAFLVACEVHSADTKSMSPTASRLRQVQGKLEGEVLDAAGHVAE